MSHIFKILSIDPGLTNTAWVLSNADIDNYTLNVLKYNTIKATKSIEKNENPLGLNRNILSLQYLENELRSIISASKADFIVIEDAFYNPKRPTAFLSLSLCIYTIEKLVAMTFNKKIYKIATRKAKQLVSGNGGSTKDVIQRAIVDNEHITFKESKQYSIDRLNEHEADAIAIAYGFMVSTDKEVFLNYTETK